jgi:ABC-2 type transport system permease protein
MKRAASPARSIAAMTAMEVRLVLRRGENLFATIVIPTLVLVLFSSVAVIDFGGARPVDFLLPGSIALAIIATSLVSLGITTAYDRSYGVLKRLGGSPLSRPELIAARILTVLVVEAVQIGLLIGTAAGLLGWTPSVPPSVPLLLGGVLLGTIAFAGLGLLLAGLLRAETTLAVANLLFLAFMALGGVIVPVDRLPGAAAAIAHALPAAALSDVLRIALGSAAAATPGSAGIADAASPLALLAVWAVGAVSLAAATFSWE